MNTRDNLLKTIEKSGWHLTNESVEEFLTEKSNLTANDLIKKALDCDLRNIGSKNLPDLVVSGKADNFNGANCVVQLAKLRNIGAPKDNETSMTAPPMYKITLTDGTSNCNALVLDNISKLNLDTPPGTKILLTGNIKIKSNLLILNNSNCKNLGGFVDYLVTKWKTNKDLLQHVRAMNMTEIAPPPWVPFGTKQINQVDTSKKVLAQNEKPEEDGTSEFSQARQAALAEAMQAKSKVTKTFTQQTIDKSQIEKAASAPVPASSALTSNTFTLSTNKQTTKPVKKGGRRNRNKDSDEEDYKDVKDAAKPSSVTLFDLFKTKLDIQDDSEDQKSQLTASNNTAYERGQSGGRGRGRGGRGGNRGGRQSFFNQQQQQTQNDKKQVYNQDDFAYDLGDSTNVKDLAAIKSFEKKSHQQNLSIHSNENKNNSNFNSQLQNNERKNDNNNFNQRQNSSQNNNNNNNNNYQNNYKQNYNNNNNNYNNNNNNNNNNTNNNNTNNNNNPNNRGRNYNNNNNNNRNSNYQNYPNQMQQQPIQPVMYAQQQYPSNDFYQMPPPMMQPPPNQYYQNQSSMNYPQPQINQQNYQNKNNFRPRGQNHNNNNNQRGGYRN